MDNNGERQLSPFQQKWHNIIFEADTPLGKAFDIVLLIAILISVTVVMLESVATVQVKYNQLFNLLEWIFTIVFTIEYLFRVWCSYRPKAYIGSFYGIVDLLCILPSYAEIIFGGAHFLLTIRILRLMRIFRIFKLVPFLNESRQLTSALQHSRRKIMVFFFFIGLLTIVLGAIMYVIESGHNSGFTSIPVSVYWAVVTLTTVGYGDIAPVTPIGQAFSAIIMIMGYAIIAVPTGIVTVEMSRIRSRDEVDQRICPHCMREGHDTNADYCKFCGSKL
jgi:voltage-gated potassium channel